MRLSQFLAGLFLLAFPLLLASQSAEMSPQQVLVENSKYTPLALYDSTEPYYERKPVNGVIDLSGGMLNDYATGGPFAEKLLPKDQLRQALQQYPVVVAGIATAQQSALSPRQSYIVSDWTFQITQVYRNASKLPIVIGKTITVARTSGTVTMGKLKLIAHDRNFPDFELQRRYVLALEPITTTRSFFADGNASFDITGANVAFMDTDPNTPWSDLRDWVASYSPRDFQSLIESMEAEERAR
jgi:hypothetical protein